MVDIDDEIKEKKDTYHVNMVECWDKEENKVSRFLTRHTMNEVDCISDKTIKPSIYNNSVFIEELPIPKWCGGLDMTIEGLPFSIMQADSIQGTIFPLSPIKPYRNYAYYV